jgi:hypothetical protein
MTNPIAKLLLALLTLAMMTGAAQPQQPTYYASSGKVVGWSSTDSVGTHPAVSASATMIATITMKADASG